MYYLNSFLLYSVLGFIMESTLYKNTSFKASGVLFGPVTLVYGAGTVILLLINKYFLEKIILAFLVYAIILTLTELVCGHLCHLIFGIDMWDYTNKKYNFGKYICLELVPIWGILGLLVTYVLKPFFDKVIRLIPQEATYLFYFFLTVDFLITIITK